MRGYAYDFLAILHAVSVILTLLWLPFGKFFHIFVRPTHLGVGLYKDEGKAGEQALCRRCRQPFASRLQVEDLITVQRQLGYHYEVANHKSQITNLNPEAIGVCDLQFEICEEVEHYQWVCPACRRSLLALAQGALWSAATAPLPQPDLTPHSNGQASARSASTLC
jgi:hypothetical protein